MAQDISLWGATYPDVPGILLPKSSSGTALFVDPSETTATAADVAAGKLFLTAAGVLTQGTASGGGGGGLEYESGTYTPSSDITQPTISFSKTHSTRPFYAGIADATGGSQAPSTDSIMTVMFFSWYDIFGTTVKRGSSSYYARAAGAYVSSSGTGSSNSSISGLSGSGSSYMPYWLTTSSFMPYSGSSSRYFRANRTYKWIAVWAPTT